MNLRSLRLCLFSLLLLALPLRSFAALSAATVWEVRAATGSDSNGGGFVAGATGTDYSQQAVSQFSGTDLAVDATTNTKVTAASHNFVAADVGNLLNIVGAGAFTAGFYQIVSVAANAATLDRSPAATSSTGGTWAEGGALATLGVLSTAMVTSNKAYVTGAFTATATTTFGQTGANPGGGAPMTRLIGYGAARGDGTHATLTLSTNTGLVGIKSTCTGFSVEQVDVNCSSLGTSTGIQLFQNYQTARACLVSNFTANGIQMGAIYDGVTGCEVTGGTAAATAGINLTSGIAFVLRCNVHDNAAPGILLLSGVIAAGNLVTNNSGAASDGIQVITSGFANTLLNNTCHGNGRDGIRIASTLGIADSFRNNLLTSNGGFGITGTTGTALPAASEYDGNAYWNNTSGARNNMDSVAGIYAVSPYTNVRDVTLTGSPYVGPTTGSTANFALNRTAGAGLACQGAGSPSTWAGNTGTTGYPDMGAVQHKIPKRIEIIH